ncbi:MAG TPA: Asp23/Gls24 family envelope stress response protein [Gaiellaceae bacterium]|nr:Asp23/Gls24 family envelope stress response protein [Gaiellaceae bacterium]
MQHEEIVVSTSDLGRIAVSSGAIAQIVGAAAAESYGVVALAGRGRVSRLLPWGLKKGVDVERRDDGLAIQLRVVVEHGLKLVEVAAAVRSRVLYELERMVGMPVAVLDVHIERVRSR